LLPLANLAFLPLPGLILERARLIISIPSPPTTEWVHPESNKALTL